MCNFKKNLNFLITLNQYKNTNWDKKCFMESKIKNKIYVFQMNIYLIKIIHFLIIIQLETRPSLPKIKLIKKCSMMNVLQ